MMTTNSVETESDPSSPVAVAYLGPTGTYGNKAADVFREALRVRLDGPDHARSIKLVPYQTITDVYNSSTAYSVIPIENTIHGAVLESLDCLLNPSSSEHLRPRIIAETCLAISHSLLAVRGTLLADITFVQSHEQALGQCSNWMASHLKQGVEKRQWDSTAGAAMSLVNPTGEDGIGAAICSKNVADLHPELEVLAEGIQDRQLNSTRFLLLTRNPEYEHSRADSSVRFIRATESATITRLAKIPGVSITAVHSRPARVDEGSGEMFPRRYLLEVHVDGWTDPKGLKDVMAAADVWDLGGWRG